MNGWFTDDTAARFRAYGWNVIGPIDGHDAVSVDAAIRDAHASDGRPSLVICRTKIGWGSPNKADTHDVHGAPLGADEIAATREALEWPHAPFEIPDDVRASWCQRARGAALAREWDVLGFLMARSGKVVPKEHIALASNAWDQGVSDNAIEVCLSRLRAKIEPGGVQLRTVRGLGYLLEEIG